MRENALGHVVYAPDEKGVIKLAGYPDFEIQRLGCFTANGKFFREFGITEGSLLLAEFQATPHEGDLVITGSVEDPAVKLYRQSKSASNQPDAIPTVTNRKEIIAVILSSFNFFV